ncbi:MAG: glycosyltransferase [Alphaproteobacteria bacterium]|nr:glycosyltransferase [Alphaproteobacteria bacterium]
MNESFATAAVNTSATGIPTVTIIVTQRERTSLTKRSLENILTDTSEPFRLIYVDGGTPDHIGAYLEHRKVDAGFSIVRQQGWLWPNAARNLALSTVDTKYIVFIDNDVVVEPGWLQKLVACAEETGAALVGPLYLWSDGVDEARIHMSGGTLTRIDTPNGIALHERHDDINAPLSRRAELNRGPCDFLEYHCMLVRTDFLRSIGGLSETIVSVHEHIDIALAATKAGEAIVMEPASAVTYLAFAPYLLSDLAFFRWRWNAQAADESIRAFCKKWDLADDDAAFSGVRNFVHTHASALDPLLPDPKSVRPAAPLAAHDIRQNLYGLLTQASAQGYVKEDLENLSSAYNAAMTMFAGGFRPCARPFIAHCTGTASALVAFGFAPRLAVAGLLHAAYSHAPLGPQPSAALQDLANQLRATFGDRVERLIRSYSRLQLDPQTWQATHPLDTLTLDDAETIAIAIANSIDECAAGEPLFSAKRLPAANWIAYAHAVATALGVPSFAETLARLSEVTPPAGFDMRRPLGESFRLVKGGLAPMAHGAFRAWDKIQSAPMELPPARAGSLSR